MLCNTVSFFFFMPADSANFVEMYKYTNKLINETSPYLLQHAHNPVDWYPWGDEAFDKAKKENKPILVSIGYAACHWCHVMEQESFEDEATASLMNEHFVNIKIDREERPDIDHIYMDAVQAMTGSGGWPLNVFLTPDKKPFYGGTYFPPQKAFNRASWTEVLQGITNAFNGKRDEINTQAESLTDYLLQSGSFGKQGGTDDSSFTKQALDEPFQNIMKNADKEWGGFGRAPKFPQTFTIQFLFRYFNITKDKEALNQALLSLDKMIQGGIYDQLRGGFARYSTDTEWLAPHFEKMLYDNALLVMVLSEAYQLTQKERYKEIIAETIEFVQRELLHPQKGFYSALDADSEGEEGRFYVWDLSEVKNILGEDSDIFCKYFDISEKGNWEGKNILRIKTPVQQFSAENNIVADELKKILQRSKAKLIEQQNKRIRPLLDDKIILGWNALMNTACSKAFEATGNEEYRQLAISNMHFLFKKLNNENQNEFYHTWKNDHAKYPAFLDDYAFLVQALIQLYEITADTEWLTKGKEITEYAVAHFSEEQTGFFYFTNDRQQDVILRKKEIYDGAVPSGNSIMAYNLYRLAIFFDIKEWKERSFNMVGSIVNIITKHPTSFGIWNCLLLEIIMGTHEVAVVGKGAAAIHKNLLKQFIPQRVLMVSENDNNDFPLIKEKLSTNSTLIYLCKDFICLKPVSSVSDLMLLIDKGRVNK